MDTCKLLVIAALCLGLVWGHGMVMDPINRSSRWRVDSHAPINWDDDQNYCGSFGALWEINHGKCGLCGDDYRDATPRANENGGKYGKGVVVKNYQKNSVIDVLVRLTTNHMGYFEFHLCPLESNKATETEECFKPLQLVDGSYRYKLTKHGSGDFHVSLRLPTDLTCKFCVLRWVYVAGNSWGNCGDGTEGMGCGEQEQFRSCSDIAIL